MDVVRWKPGSTMSLLAKDESTDQSRTSEDAGKMPKTKPPQASYIVIQKSNRSALEWAFGLIIMFLLCGCAVLAAEFALLFVRQQSEKDVEIQNQEILKANLITESSVVCLTPECLHQASKVLGYGDFHTDPCTDFYQFACGGYEKQDAVENTRNLLDEKTAAAMEKIRALISEPEHFSDPASVRKAKTFYASCVDVATIEERRLKPMLTLLDKVGGWPVLRKNTWKEVASWQDLANRYRKANLPVNFFFEPRVIFQGDKKLKLVLGLSAAVHGLYALEVSQHEDYHDRLVQTAILFGAEEAAAQLEMKNVFYFETMLKQEYWRHFNLNELYVTMELSRLQHIVPSVNWTKYVGSFLPFRIRENDTIVVESPQFIVRFVELLENVDIRTLANYAATRVVWNLAPLLTNKLKRVVGKMAAPQRTRECSDIVGNHFGIPLAAFYVKKHFQDDTKAMTEDLVDYIKAGFFTAFDETSWKNATIDKAKHQVNDIKTFVGYPEDILNETSIDDLYASLTMNSKEYFENYRKVLTYLRDRGFTLLKQKPEALTSWEQNGGAALADSIMYFFQTDTIFIPAIIIQEVFQVQKNFHYTNFGSLGASIAREIAKGLRIGGDLRQVRSTIGHPANDTMWCIAKQFLNISSEYDQFKTSSMVEDFQMPWEEIEDYIDHYRGLEASYKAYILWRQSKGWLEPVYPGMNFTANQFFWISYANSFCSKPTPGGYFFHHALARSSLRNRLRVNLAVANMPQFGRDFQCEEKLMNPSVKCTSW